MLTDRERLNTLLRNSQEMPVTDADLVEAHRVMTVRVAAVVSRDPRDRPPENKAELRARKRAARGQRARATTSSCAARSRTRAIAR